MAKFDLTLERLYELTDYNLQTGIFVRRVATGRHGCHMAGEEMGCVSRHSGYVFIGVDWFDYRAHVLAWLYVYGEWPQSKLDHRNGVRSDNRIDNLRLAATQALNCQNRQNVFGATFNKQAGKWQARLTVDAKRIFLGNHTELADAQTAYFAAKAKYHPFWCQFDREMLDEPDDGLSAGL